MQEISLHIMDIAQNSITAKATLIQISLNITKDEIIIEIEDNGCGMSEEMLKNVISPFVTTRTTRKVGMGISLFAQGAQDTGGKFSITSKLNEGTKLKAVYIKNSIDRPPIGDFTGTMHSLIICNPEIDFIVKIINEEENVMDTREVKEILGDVAIDTPDVSLWIKENLEEMALNTDFN